MSSMNDRLRAIKEGAARHRMMEVMHGEIDIEARTVPLAFSSEAEVSTFFGIEILDHSPGAVVLDRMRDSAAVLMDHDWTDQVGVVDSVTIGADRKGRAVTRFGRGVRASEIFQDVVDRIRTHVSVGYRVLDARVIEERDGVDVWLVTSWEPYEISILAVPADITVGIGRSMEIPQEDPVKPAGEDGAQLNPDQPEDVPNMPETVPATPAPNLDAARQAGADGERNRVRELAELGNAYGAPDLAIQFAAEGKCVADLQRALLDKLVRERASTPLAEQARAGEIGLNDKEVRQFSILRAARALAHPTDRQAQADAKFEFECSDTAQRTFGKSSQGVMIPPDVLRAFSTTTPAGGSGSNVVATNLLASSFIELLRHRTWAMKRVTTLGGLVGNVEIPRQKAATSAYWVGEGQPPTEGEPGADLVGFTPKSLAAFTDITRRLMAQATPDAELLVRNDILRVMALALDYAVPYGTGNANQPTGLKAVAGIESVDFAAADPTYLEYVAMETAIAAADADIGSMAYVINATARGKAKSTQKFPGTPTGATIWEQGNTINGHATEVTNQITAGDVFFGNWSDFVVAMWGGLDLKVDPYALSTSGGTRIIAFQDVDMNVRHPQSFCYGVHS